MGGWMGGWMDGWMDGWEVEKVKGETTPCTYLNIIVIIKPRVGTLDDAGLVSIATCTPTNTRQLTRYQYCRISIDGKLIREGGRR